MTAQPLVAREEKEDRARIVGHVDLPAAREDCPASVSDADDGFLTGMTGTPWSSDHLQREHARVLAEIDELKAENRWEDILTLFHPIEEKTPELAAAGMTGELRLAMGFVLGRAGRHHEAMTCIEQVTRDEPDNGLAHYSMAYAVLDGLYAARARKSLLPPREKARLIRLGHRHFEQACRLRPDSVTFHYRHGILYKEIENKPRRAIPLFERAMANWDRLDAKTRKKRHQQFPKYIKSMYHLASCLLATGRPGQSLKLMERVLEKDEGRNHMQPLFRHYAMGKILHALGRPGPALEHLETALIRADKKQPMDFIFELAARCALQLGQSDRAASYIARAATGRSRPYIHHTEADVLLAQGKPDQALTLLTKSAEQDRRSRHKSLIRMGRIHLNQGRPEEAEKCCREAVEFCRSTFGNPSHEAMFWQAAALYQQNRHEQAAAILTKLRTHNFRYPNLNRLAELVSRALKHGREQSALSLVK